MTLGLDILLLNIDPNLRRVREREYAGYAMRAADLIELAVAGRVTLTGRWVKWITVVDAEPTGEPLLDASLAALATAPKRLMPVDWMCRSRPVAWSRRAWPCWPGRARCGCTPGR